MKELIHGLKNGVLPGCFQLESHTVSFDNSEEFRALSDDVTSFMSFVEQNTAVGNTGAYVDCFESGFLGALALALWFMEFDEDNWFSFRDVHRVIGEIFTARGRKRERIELRLVKGSYPPMILDQPVILDWRDNKISFLFGKLSD